MTLIWEWLDIWLSKLRSVQRVYLLEPNYFELQVYDYVDFDDTVIATTGRTPEDEDNI